METLKEIIMDLIADNKEYKSCCDYTEYNDGYTDGYHDALVDLMNNLDIDHDEEYVNH